MQHPHLILLLRCPKDFCNGSAIHGDCWGMLANLQAGSSAGTEHPVRLGKERGGAPCTGSACPVLPVTSGSSLGTSGSSTGTLGSSTGTLSSGKLRNGWPDFTAWHTCENSDRMCSTDGAEQHQALPTPVPLPACLVTDPARPFPPCQPRFLPSGETLEPALGSLLLQRLRLSPKTLFLHFS